MKKSQITTRKLVISAMLAAMYVALCFAKIRIGTLQITVSSLPVIMGGLLFGPLWGFAVGFIGSFFEQLLTYGVDFTTILWLVPIGVRGLMVGAYAKAKKTELDRKQLCFILILSSLVVTTLNTASIYLHSVIWDYYTFAYVFGSIVSRYLAGVLTAVVLVIVVPELMRLLRKSRILPRYE
ncbi:MAG: ECF transporter S component [Oscillospiraceae bacterium]|nr:ECF transporter S component [Oscillospiraceae bacterium]